MTSGPRREIRDELIADALEIAGCASGDTTADAAGMLAGLFLVAVGFFDDLDDEARP